MPYASQVTLVIVLRMTLMTFLSIGNSTSIWPTANRLNAVTKYPAPVAKVPMARVGRRLK